MWLEDGGTFHLDEEETGAVGDPPNGRKKERKKEIRYIAIIHARYGGDLVKTCKEIRQEHASRVGSDAV